MDIWRRNRWKFLPMKELRTSLKKILMEAGFTQAELAFEKPVEEICGYEEI